ncbi:peptidyl-tRNA hydrolase domain-containing protein [Histoplasma ohiense]|uniref:Peptidyl-tRNA hydrolase domain-containing protein n=1 Tax=Ajellomyces capsulatus TaxID=5037 RepID=A0A8H7Z9I7_AJECA|nr:peptidyl-tRNA hydrolase domain-containing protein [Histoplasma ohiense (nom. inval.)]KAG5303720.1 peptidyl-tRNA hydrolase domain-containing protein [Histoplasma capsulatum]QSS69316.1 peptidyl-tRNA hydrolase domain-containing protein [Histoplasma capsulatum G186AR]
MLRIPFSYPRTVFTTRVFFPTVSTRYLASSRCPKAQEFTDEELAIARSWLSQLTPRTIPRDIGDVSYSRSSGPGGQNVNKVNSKVTLKIPLSTILRLVPRALHAQIRSSRYIAERSDSLVIQSDETRKQTKNLDLCFEKLRELLLTAGKMAIPGETSPEQRKKVQALEKANNESRIRSKKARSMKKSSRRSSGYDD